MKAYTKTVFRNFKSNIARFAAITVIIFLGIAFVSGLGTLSPTVTDSFGRYLSERGAADVIVKSVSPAGFTDGELAALAAHGTVGGIQPFTALDAETDGHNARIYLMPLRSMAVNPVTLEGGRWPQSADEIVAERASHSVEETKIGEKIEALGAPRTVVGIVSNPLTFSKEGDADNVNQRPLDRIVYLDSALANLPLPVTDVYVRLSVRSGGYLTKEYDKSVQSGIAALKESHGDFVFLSLQETKSYAMLSSYCDKIDVICAIFPVFFIAVAALVVLTTMTRLVEEERPVIGCYQTLGYASEKIAFKYVFFSLCCCLLASALGLIIGALLLPQAIYPAFGTLFFIPEMSGAVNLLGGVVAAIAMLAAVLGVTLLVAGRELRGAPASVLRPKAPKAGKKIFLEKIPFLWKKLSFRYKSTFRNIFRYVNHFLMTLISVAGSTALVFAGFALLDVSKNDVVGAFAESFSTISVVVIAFALLLCVFVIYNLTNMNIGERRREIATLKVLGYHESEVAGYIYREIFIMALIGVLVGIPLGCGLVGFVLTYLDFGALSDVQWYSYLLTAGLVIAFIGLVDLLLVRKITSVDMTASLKSVE